MQVVYERCCGLDVHKKTVVASILITSSTGEVQKQTRTFSTMTNDLFALVSLAVVLQKLAEEHTGQEVPRSCWA